MSQHSHPFGDFHKVRGPGAKLQGGVREDSLGWREGAKGWARNRERQRGLVGAKGLQPGRTHSEQLGLTKKTTKTGLVAWLGANGVRWGAEPGSGPGTQLQQTEARGRTDWVGAKGLKPEEEPRNRTRNRTQTGVRTAWLDPGPGPGPGPAPGPEQGRARATARARALALALALAQGQGPGPGPEHQDQNSFWPRTLTKRPLIPSAGQGGLKGPSQGALQCRTQPGARTAWGLG